MSAESFEDLVSRLHEVGGKVGAVGYTWHWVLVDRNSGAQGLYWAALAVGDADTLGKGHGATKEEATLRLIERLSDVADRQ